MQLMLTGAGITQKNSENEEEHVRLIDLVLALVNPKETTDASITPWERATQLGARQVRRSSMEGLNMAAL